MKEEIIRQAIDMLDNLDAKKIIDIQIGTFVSDGSEHTSIDFRTKVTTNACPDCGSDDVEEIVTVDAEGSVFSRSINCNKCNNLRETK